MNRLTVLMLLLISRALPAAQIIIDEATAVNGEVRLSYHVDRLFDDKSLELLRRGVASMVVHHVQLWRQKSFVDPLIKEHFITFRIFYDSWEKKYRIVGDEENRLTAQLESVRQRCSAVKDLSIVPLSELEPGGVWYISISVRFRPISSESLNTVESLFEEGRRSGRFLSVLVNLLGMGDRTVEVKTANFRIDESGNLWFPR